VWWRLYYHCVSLGVLVYSTRSTPECIIKEDAPLRNATACCLLTGWGWEFLAYQQDDANSTALDEWQWPTSKPSPSFKSFQVNRAHNRAGAMTIKDETSSVSVAHPCVATRSSDKYHAEIGLDNGYESGHCDMLLVVRGSCAGYRLLEVYVGLTSSTYVVVKELCLLSTPPRPRYLHYVRTQKVQDKVPYLSRRDSGTWLMVGLADWWFGHADSTATKGGTSMRPSWDGNAMI
jgi:hypothetical protein